jgi:hypothetical protein
LPSQSCITDRHPSRQPSIFSHLRLINVAILVVVDIGKYLLDVVDSCPDLGKLQENFREVHVGELRLLLGGLKGDDDPLLHWIEVFHI